MSDPLWIALVAEGPTDKIVVEAAIRNILEDTPFILRQLQPEESLAFVDPGDSTGWGGVYRWCRRAAERSTGAIESDVLFATYKILIIHLDAEVAGEEYGHANIVDGENDLPCSQPCPPPTASTDPLRSVLLRWIGSATVPQGVVLCTPSRNTETWVLCALYPRDAIVQSGSVECFESPQNRLQSKPMSGRVITRRKKRVVAYRARAKDISESWPDVRILCTEAERFSADFESAVP